MSTGVYGGHYLCCNNPGGCGREFAVPAGTLRADGTLWGQLRLLAKAEGWQTAVSPDPGITVIAYSKLFDYCPQHRADAPSGDEGEANSWELPLTQALTLEVLAARFRGGDLTWPFPVKSRRSLQALQAKGLIGFQRGSQPRSLVAWLTTRGRALVLMPGYRTPLSRLLDEAVHLRQNGEYAPGGRENWNDWDRRAESFLRVALGGHQ